MMAKRERMLGGLWGALVGDALGVPVEFMGRERLRANPVTDMRGYGTHNQPAGTWSDDSSLLVCSAESLLSGFDTTDMGKRFVNWYRHGYWGAHGTVFDIGGATAQALGRIERGIAAEEAGGTSDRDNGNGSLMRILPVALAFADAPLDTLLNHAHRASKITHGHYRSQMGCGIYCVFVSYLLHGETPPDAYRHTIDALRPIYDTASWGVEFPHYARFFSGNIGSADENDIKSGGYVVHTLEASVWCLLTTPGYDAAVLKAVNLGDDTDTTATVVGGLVGVHYGDTAIPARWRDQIARHDDLAALFEKFVTTYS